MGGKVFQIPFLMFFFSWIDEKWFTIIMSIFVSVVITKKCLVDPQNNEESIVRKGLKDFIANMKVFLGIWSTDFSIMTGSFFKKQKEKQIENTQAQMPWQPGPVTWISVAFSTLPLAGKMVFWKRLTWNWQTNYTVEDIQVFLNCF